MCKLPFEDKSGLVITFFITITIITGIVVILRLLSKALGTNEFVLEDYIISLSMVGATLYLLWIFADRYSYYRSLPPYLLSSVRTCYTWLGFRTNHVSFKRRVRKTPL